MAIKKVHSVYTVVRNMDALEAFYTQLLGVAPRFRDGDRWTQFSLDNTQFALSSTEEAAAGATGCVVVFQAETTAGVPEAVRQAGGTFVSERDMGPHGVVQTFSDPEGRPFQVFAKPSSSHQPVGN